MHVTLYCTWRPSGLATGLRGQLDIRLLVRQKRTLVQRFGNRWFVYFSQFPSVFTYVWTVVSSCFMTLVKNISVVVSSWSSIIKEISKERQLLFKLLLDMYARLTSSFCSDAASYICRSSQRQPTLHYQYWTASY